MYNCEQQQEVRPLYTLNGEWFSMRRSECTPVLRETCPTFPVFFNIKAGVGLCILTACEGRVNGNHINSSVATSQRTHLVPTTNTCRLLVHTEIIVVYYKKHTEHKCFGKYIIIQMLK